MAGLEEGPDKSWEAASHSDFSHRPHNKTSKGAVECTPEVKEESGNVFLSSYGEAGFFRKIDKGVCSRSESAESVLVRGQIACLF